MLKMLLMHFFPSCILHSPFSIFYCKLEELMEIHLTDKVTRCRAWRICVGLILISCSNTGCIYGSLASDTGFSKAGNWSVARIQDAHVGETVKFSFILREWFQANRIDALGVADYAAANILEQRIETAPDISSAFLFEHALRGIKPGRSIAVEVKAFQIKGSKDYMKIRGEWHRSMSAVDEPDKMVAKASIKLRTYQSRIDYAFGKPQVDLDWAGARLVITRNDGKVSTVFADQPHRPGFTMNGPDREGYYHIQYFPLAEQINKTGTTRAALKVLDVNGVQQTYDFEFDTP